MFGLDQILTSKDVEEIEVKEERDGLCIQATDMVFEKLMAIQTPGWPEIHKFLAALEQQHPNVAKALRDTYQFLKDDAFAKINFLVEGEPWVPLGIAY